MTSVLLVDDDAETCREIEGFLSRRGWETSCAASAQEAIDAMEQQDFDVVFTDIEMPGAMNGIDLAHWATRHRPDSTVVLTSGAFPWIGAGSPIAHVAFLTKPVDLDGMEKKLREELRKRHPGATGPAAQARSYAHLPNAAD